VFPLQFFFKEGSKIGLKFSIPAPITLAVVGVAPVTLPLDVPLSWGVNVGTIFGGIAFLKFWRAKKRPKVGAM